jgi:hypothetical protein
MNFEPCHLANIGYGKPPKADCENCKGNGFRYIGGWAYTCFCKAI